MGVEEGLELGGGNLRGRDDRRSVQRAGVRAEEEEPGDLPNEVSVLSTLG